MKPAVKTAVVLGLTATGLTVTLRYRTPAQPLPSSVMAARAATVAGAPPSPQIAASASATRPVGVRTRRTVTIVRTVTVGGGSAGTSRTSAPTPNHTAAANVPTQTYTCQTFQAGTFGPVQVAVKIQGNRWADVVNLQLPSGNSTNEQINSYAGPQLRQEALHAENAHIQTVSGATYTSDAYRESLQSCVDQWSG